jgi:PAT family beta-lactamase induction signal transducer AmpG
MSKTKRKFRNPWTWVPSLYFAEGIPYVIVMTVAVIMYKRLGISNAEIALYTSWLYLPWVLKPLWSPIVDMFKTKRLWIIIMQLIIGAGLGGVALTIPLPAFFQYTLAFFWLLAFSSATHDIAADGFYMLGLSKHDQAFFVGVRSTFYRFAMITGQGLLIILAGYFESTTGLPAVTARINSSPDTESVLIIQPDSVSVSPMEGSLRVVVVPEELNIPTSSINKAEFNSLKDRIKKWNVENGFYSIEEMQQNTGSAIAEDEGLNWLEKLIVDLFGEEKKEPAKGNMTGNAGTVYFHLSGKPDAGEEIVVNFGRDTGDKSISLIEGARFTFNDKNWNKPAYALIQLDPKLKDASSAIFEARAGNVPLSWVITFTILTFMFILFFIYHKFILPYPDTDKPTLASKESGIFKEFFTTFALFFKKKHIGVILGFLLLYRLGESQLVKLASPFLLDTSEVGGLGLTTGEVGIVYGTVGIIALTLGGLLGGFLAARHGLKYWLWYMVIAINLPNIVYVYLSAALRPLILPLLQRLWHWV